MPVRKPNPIGAHVPVTGGLRRGALGYARRVGAEAVQLFISNPRGWAVGAADPEADRGFAEDCAAERIAVFVHAPYLVNLASPTALTVERSALALRHALERGARLGARGVVVHAGSAVDRDARVGGLAQVREHLLPLLDGLPADAPALLIEPTAGGGQALAARMADLAEYFAALEHHPRLGVCLDMCHALAAGHDLVAPGGVRATLNELGRAVGRGRLGLVHVNDSRDPLGSCRDRHASLGGGTIGIEPLRELFVHPQTRAVPLVVETPGGEEGHRGDIELLKKLRAAPH